VPNQACYNRTERKQQLGEEMSTGLVGAWIFAALVEIVVPILVAIWFGHKYHVKVAPFLYGAAVFIVFQMILRVPLVQILSAQISPHLVGRIGLQVVYLAVLAFTAALVETGGRWLGYRFVFGKLQKNWANGVAYGLGHGTAESALLVGLNAVSNLVVALAVGAMGTEALAALDPTVAAQLASVPQALTDAGVIAPLLGALERMLTIPFHVAMSLLVLLSFTRGQSKWFWLAMAAHTFVDFTAPCLSAFTTLPSWGIELYIAIFTALSVFLILKLKGEGDTEPIPIEAPQSI